VTDFVGRWGGDEFVVLMEGGITEAEARAGRIRQWALGEYTLDAGGRKVKTNVSAGIGVVEWDKGEAGRQLLDRADQKLYQAKSSKSDVPNLQPV
jgi:diguanylate cyclase (GGDEF)-like protein